VENVEKVDRHATILVVEDEIEIRRMLADALSSDYEVLQAEHGLAALELIDGGALLDMVLTDLVMPRMDGLGLTSTIQAQSPLLPVVVMTAHDDRQQILAALRAGAYDFIAKPFELDVMEAAVKRAVDHARYLRLQREQLELRGAMATAMRAAHEINNPLLVIKSIAEYHLMYADKLDAELRDDLSKVNQAVDSLAQQVRLMTQIRRVIVDERLGFPLLDLERAVTPEPGTESSAGPDADPPSSPDKEGDGASLHAREVGG
jgi:CheY-like chemotaxis protein